MYSQYDHPDCCVFAKLNIALSISVNGHKCEAEDKKIAADMRKIL